MNPERNDRQQRNLRDVHAGKLGHRGRQVGAWQRRRWQERIRGIQRGREVSLRREEVVGCQRVDGSVRDGSGVSSVSGDGSSSRAISAGFTSASRFPHRVRAAFTPSVRIVSPARRLSCLLVQPTRLPERYETKTARDTATRSTRVRSRSKSAKCAATTGSNCMASLSSSTVWTPPLTNRIRVDRTLLAERRGFCARRGGGSREGNLVLACRRHVRARTDPGGDVVAETPGAGPRPRRGQAPSQRRRQPVCVSPDH